MDLDILLKSCADVRRRLEARHPACALILGSGWGAVCDTMRVHTAMDYGDIPALGATAVAGHAGRLLSASAAGVELLVFQGRRHWYEGAGWEPVLFPVLLCRELAVPCLLLTNAAGGIRRELAPGRIMIIDDHINFMGVNPLVGPHPPSFGDRFPDQSEVYDRRLRGMLDAAAEDIREPVEHGVYAAVSGPVYETPAEIRALRTLGADAVGMSTVPEAMVASSLGMRVAALSCISNHAAGIADARLDHKEMIARSRDSMPRLKALLGAFLARVAAAEPP